MDGTEGSISGVKGEGSNHRDKLDADLRSQKEREFEKAVKRIDGRSPNRVRKRREEDWKTPRSNLPVMPVENQSTGCKKGIMRCGNLTSISDLAVSYLNLKGPFSGFSY